MAYGRERHPVPSVPRLWQNMKRSPNDKPEKIAIDPKQKFAVPTQMPQTRPTEPGVCT